MREGYWVNYQNGRKFPVDEHEVWIRVPGNAKKLGVPPNVIAKFGDFKPVTDRDKFLLFVLKNAPVMRVRGHGVMIAFEYASHDRQAAIEAVWMLAKEDAGPFSEIYIVNFATKESVEMKFQQLDELMDSGGAEAVMRAASCKGFSIKKAIAKELLEISKEILK